MAGDADVNNSDPTHGTAMAYTILRAVAQQSGGGSSAEFWPWTFMAPSETTTSWNVAFGIQAAVDNGATVLNLSLGGPSDSAILDNVMQQAIAAGIPVYAAAGNQPVSTPTYPAADPGVIAVTATQGGQLASYANFGSFVALAHAGCERGLFRRPAVCRPGNLTGDGLCDGRGGGDEGGGLSAWTQIQSAMQQKFAVPK